MSNDTQPEIRFPGFTDDWEQRKLGEVVQIVMGQSPNSENYTDNPNDYILVQGNADMKNNRVVPRVWTTQVTKQAEKGDLILSVRAPVGDIGKTDYDVVLGRGVAAIKGNDFIFQQLGKMKENGYWNRYSTGSTFESINSNDIREALITIPDVKEQQKIGAFFKQLDDTIALHQRKLDLLKETKKGFLQKMFPKNGAKVPEIRFPGFTEDWEQRKLGEVSPLRGGFAFKSNKFVKEGIPIVRISNILSNGSVGGEFVYYTAQEKDENYLLPDKSALLAMSGATTGKVSILNNPNNNKVYQNQRVGYFTKTKNVDYSFISTLVRSKIFLDQLNSVLVAGAQPNISSKDINVFELTIPKNIEEQKKIGNFFKQLDDTIALHQRKLDLLKETKKGFLQKMFV
ncbi:restriction endonuclease subunit S [Enterococcus faecium]|uniref:restriction endonuclease subunit S n=1 Tax=Enterococcus faecium TaxID=1352 RepID=UPI003841CC51|nr:restriction endonuclease subunit S [Enterococcus faecium]